MYHRTLTDLLIKIDIVKNRIDSYWYTNLIVRSNFIWITVSSSSQALQGSFCRISTKLMIRLR